MWAGGGGGGRLSGAVCAMQSDWQRDTSASDILFEVEGGPQETSSFIVGSRKGRETSMTAFFFSLFVHGHCRPLCILRLIFVNLKKKMYIKKETKLSAAFPGALFSVTDLKSLTSFGGREGWTFFICLFKS